MAVTLNNEQRHRRRTNGAGMANLKNNGGIAATALARHKRAGDISVAATRLFH